MSSEQQVWHTAVPPPTWNSSTARLYRSSLRSPSSTSNPRSPSSASNPRSPSSASNPRSPGASSNPRSPSASSNPRSPSSTSNPRSPSSAINLRYPSAASNPRYPGAANNPRSPSSAINLRYPSAASNPRYPSSSSHPGSPSSAINPRSPIFASNPRSPSSASNPRSPSSASNPRSPSSASNPRSPGTPGSEKVASPLECSICFSGYDNIFKTPKELSCTHVFCLECLARLAAAQPMGRPGSEAMPCPFCRQPTTVPPAGAPALRTSRQLLAMMPAHLRREEPVWLEGTKLCCRPPPSEAGNMSPDLVCVDVGLSKPAEPVPPQVPAEPERRRGRLARCWARCKEWRRMALVSTLLLVLFCLVLWPVQCALKTGNLRCFPSPRVTTTTTTATLPLVPLAEN